MGYKHKIKLMMIVDNTIDLTMEQHEGTVIVKMFNTNISHNVNCIYTGTIQKFTFDLNHC